MATTTSIFVCRRALGLMSVGLIVGMMACQTGLQNGDGQQRTLRLDVGEIKEITLPSQGDSPLELIGTSDNQEVVEVSRPELAPPIDTLQQRAAKPTVFQVKGITQGTANVVFSTKSAAQAGSGKPLRTYRIQVRAN